MTDPDAYKHWSPAAQEKALQRVQELTAKKWRPFYCPTPTCDGSPHGEWEWNHARVDQRPPNDPDWLVWLLMSGRGCVAPWTRVFDASTGQHRRIDSITEPIQVESTDGPTWTDGSPFLKGQAHQWTVTTTDGRAITGTDQHRFLTPDGWRRLEDMHVGQLVAVSTHVPLELDSLSRSASRAGGQRCSGTASDCRHSCSTCRRRCDPRPQKATGADRFDAQPPVGASSPDCADCGTGAQASKSAGSPRGQRESHRPRNSFGPVGPALQAGRSPTRSSSTSELRPVLPAEMQSQPQSESRQREVRRHLSTGGTLSSLPLCLDATSPSLCCPESQPPVPSSAYARSDTTLRSVSQALEGSLQSGTDLLSRSNPSLDSITWSAVANVEYSHFGDFYDMTVPGPENYVAEGFVNHNTGKTRTGTEFIHKATRKLPRIALVAGTSTDAREVMLEGESGILTIAPPDHRPFYEPSKKRLTWPNGAIGTIFSAEEPDRLRGPEHYLAWLDEPAHWPLIQECWDNMLFGLRLGAMPRIICTTTPKTRPWLKELIADPATRTVSVSTYVNLENLSPVFAERVIGRYEGTRLGRQELHGELLTDVEGALWTWEMIEDNRTPKPERFDRIVVGIDPAGSHKKHSDETGLIATGVWDNEAYVLDDRSGKYSPSGWANKAKDMHEKWSADAYVVERNFGGDMVESTMRNVGIEGRILETVSSRGKELRAEPIVGLYEQGRVHHCAADGVLDDLEAQMTEWVPGDRTSVSPDRVDALVFCITELVRNRKPASVASPAKLKLVS